MLGWSRLGDAINRKFGRRTGGDWPTLGRASVESVVSWNGISENRISRIIRVDNAAKRLCTYVVALCGLPRQLSFLSYSTTAAPDVAALAGK